MKASFRRSPVFTFAVLATLGAAGLIGLMTFVMILRPGFMGMAHFSEPHHRVHDLTFGFLMSTSVVGILVQLRRPLKNIAGQLMALMPWAGLTLAAVLSTDAVVILSAESILVATLTVMTALLHPARRDFFRSFSVSRVNWVMLALVILAAVPLLSFASTNIGLQGTVKDDHAAMRHYGFMAALGFTIVGAGLLASLRPAGWRITAWVAGLLPVLLGLVSLGYPDATSSLDLVWALAAIAWGVVFVAAAELTLAPKGLALSRWEGSAVPAYPESGGEIATLPDRGSTSSTPRWVFVSGFIAIVLVLLFVIMHLTGGGPGPHPP